MTIKILNFVFTPVRLLSIPVFLCFGTPKANRIEMARLSDGQQLFVKVSFGIFFLIILILAFHQFQITCESLQVPPLS